jgi:hypothetical protein
MSPGSTLARSASANLEEVPATTISDEKAIRATIYERYRWSVTMLKKLLTIVIGLVLMTGCSELQLIGQDDLALQGSSQSACKTNSGDALSKSTTENGGVSIGVLEYAKDGDAITIYHIDALQPCEARIEFDLEVRGREIILREIDRASADSQCMCRMDLQATIANLSEGGTYLVKVYNEDMSFLFGTLEITGGEPCELECRAADDCWDRNIAHPDCGGGWACLEGYCVFECGREEFCDNDEQCPPDSLCEIGPEGLARIIHDE